MITLFSAPMNAGRALPQTMSFRVAPLTATCPKAQGQNRQHADPHRRPNAAVKCERHGRGADRPATILGNSAARTSRRVDAGGKPQRTPASNSLKHLDEILNMLPQTDRPQHSLGRCRASSLSSSLPWVLTFTLSMVSDACARSAMCAAHGGAGAWDGAATHPTHTHQTQIC